MATNYVDNAIKNLEKQAAKIKLRIDYFSGVEIEARSNKELKIQELEFINAQIKKLQTKDVKPKDLIAETGLPFE